MGMGLGIFLFVVGAVLRWALDVNIPHVNDNNLGVILMVVGAAAVVLSLIQTEQLRRQRSTNVVRDDRR